MTVSAQAILNEALKLPPIDKASMIEVLISSFDSENRHLIDKAWADESESRIDAYDAGLLKARSFEDVIRELNK